MENLDSCLPKHQESIGLPKGYEIPVRKNKIDKVLVEHAPLCSQNNQPPRTLSNDTLSTAKKCNTLRKKVGKRGNSFSEH